MFRLIFFVQAIVYLLLMPAIHDHMDTVYKPPLFVSVIAVAFLIAGFAAFKFSHPIQRTVRAAPDSKAVLGLKSRNAAPLGIAFLAILYIYVSWSNGLWNRRQGSEVMADIYGNLPLIELAILRVYEIGFIPIAVVYLFGENSRTARFFVLSILFASLPFMGIQDSRGRILVIAICLLSFIKIENFNYFIKKNIKIFIFMFIAIFAFIYASFQRLTAYARVDDYLFSEIVTRLDGLKLVSELRDFGYINYIGRFDSEMFSPLVSRIPFIEAGRIAKLEGVTSTKQYFLKYILNTNRIDESNSIILDPLYFGGLMGLAISIAALGYFIARSDCYIREGRTFSSYVRLALLLAFITSFATIEVDYFGALTTLIQNFVILFPALWIMLRRTDHSPIGRQGLAEFNAANHNPTSESIPSTSKAL